MGGRYPWVAKCPNGHEYSNFSGGPDPCPECGREPADTWTLCMWCGRVSHPGECDEDWEV